jgi:DNA polymerase-1
VVLFDGHSLAYRAFYAMPPLSTRDQTPVNAVLGFTNMLLKSIETEKPDYVALSFDRGAPVERLKEFSDYKAGRDHMPEGLGPQIGLIEDVVTAFGIPIFTSESHEADDCIGTLARRAEEKGYEVAIVSGDLDMLQLVDANVRVMATIRGISETVRYDEKAVHDRYGFPPVRIPDFKSLAGDSSDAIPGVEGIGKGTASKLIADFGSLEALLERIAEAPPRWRDKIATQAEQVKTYKRIATIETNLELDIDWERCRWDGIPIEARDLLERLEFKQVVARLERMGWFRGTVGAQHAEAAVPERPRPPDEFITVRDAAGIAAMAEAAGQPLTALALIGEGQRPVALALATSASHAHVALLQLPAEEGTLFAMRSRDGLDVSDVLRSITPRLQRTWVFDEKSLLVGYAEAFPRHLDLRDVAVASYLLESDESQKNIQAIATRHGCRVPPEKENLLGKGTHALPWEDVEADRIVAFAGETATAIWQLGEELGQRLVDTGLERLFTELELPLARILATMERLGVALDSAYLSTLAVDMDRDVERIRKQIVELAGGEFNLNSPKQLGEVLFERMGIEGGKKTKSGAYTTDFEMLSKLADKNPICARLIEYREIAKLKSTYVEALPRLVDERGRVHSSWNATVAATGRLSSSEPNLQNIPIRSELGRRIRRAFVAGAPDQVLLAADYSQIELRIMAHLAQDEKLMAIFREGGDVHAATAAEIFKVPAHDVTADMRRKAKEVNFGIMYGMGPDGLAQRIKVARNEAKDYIAAYHERFSGVARYMAEVVKSAEQTGYVETMLGRRRYLADIRSRNRMMKAAAERMATNAPIQGSAADLIKRAMVSLDGMIREGGLRARMIMQVHDELVFEVEKARLDEVAPQVRHAMETAVDCSVPIQVDLKYGTNWAQMEMWLGSPAASHA